MAKNQTLITCEHELCAEEQKHDFRVTIFGSARTKKGTPLYEDVFQLAHDLAERNITLLTGG